MMRVLGVIVGWIIGLAISWAITVGLVYLVCLCFSWQLNLLWATGIWLIMIILKSVFGGKGGE